MVNPDTRIAVDLEHRVGGLPKESKCVHLQTALLCTTLFGERRCRVSTLALRTASMAADCCHSMDFGAVVTLLMRQAASPLLSPMHDEAGDNARIKSRHNLLERCVKILASCRLRASTANSPMAQLVLPDEPQLLPLLTMGLMKCPLLHPSMPKRGSGALALASDGLRWQPTGVRQQMPCIAFCVKLLLEAGSNDGDLRF